jgi:DNA-binding NtrC family response regulator
MFVFGVWSRLQVARHVPGALRVFTSDSRLGLFVACLPKMDCWREVSITVTWRVLIVSAEMNREFVRNAMSQWAMEMVSCSSLQEARGLLPDSTLSLIFCDEMLPDGTYLDVLNIQGKTPKTRVVVISDKSHLEEQYQQAMDAGAFEIIASPCRASDVQWVVIRAIQEESRHVGRRARSL